MNIKGSMTGEEFKKIREDLKMTQFEIADMLGISRSQAQRLEYGNHPIKFAYQVMLLSRLAGKESMLSAKSCLSLSCSDDG